jgi:hypothetical protein
MVWLLLGLPQNSQDVLFIFQKHHSVWRMLPTSGMVDVFVTEETLCDACAVCPSHPLASSLPCQQLASNQVETGCEHQDCF